MDHVERLLEVRELRAIVCVCCGQSCDWRGSNAGGRGDSDTLVELAVRWGGLRRRPGYLKGKASKERVAIDLQSWVRNGEEERTPAEGGRYMESRCWTLRSEHLCDFEIPARCGLARLQIKAPRWFFL